MLLSASLGRGLAEMVLLTSPENSRGRCSDENWRNYVSKRARAFAQRENRQSQCAAISTPTVNALSDVA